MILYITKVEKVLLPKLNIFQNDYYTIDVTGDKKYIHVVDLGDGNVSVIEKLNEVVPIYNLGTGKVTSVLQSVQVFEEVNNIKIPYEIVD